MKNGQAHTWRWFKVGKTVMKLNGTEKEPLWTLRISADSDLVPEIEHQLEISELPWAEVTPEEAGPTVFEIYFHEKTKAESVMNSLRASLPRKDTTVSMELSQLDAQNWSESWKQHFHAEQVSRRIIVTPPWEKPGHVEGGVIVEINPGMSFGTGLHFTTRSCLRIIDDMQQQGLNSFCDLGCGSGILSIAAAKLGYGTVFAMDNDMTAVETTIENLKKNDVGNPVKCVQADLGEFQTGSRFDLVVANILAGALIKNSSIITQLPASSSNSRLVLSGIDEEHAEAVETEYSSRGFHSIQVEREHPWVTMVMRSAKN